MWLLIWRGGLFFFVAVVVLSDVLVRINDYTPEVEAMLDAVPLGSLSPPTGLTPPLDNDEAISISTPTLASPSPPSNLPKSNAPSPSPPLALSSASDIEHASSDELVAVCLTFVEKMRKRVAPWVLARMDAAYGPMPSDPAILSYWMALVGTDSVYWNDSRYSCTNEGHFYLGSSDRRLR